MTTFEKFDDQVTEQINNMLEQYAVDIHTMGHSYNEHIRPQSVIELLEALNVLVKAATYAEGPDRVNVAIDALKQSAQQ